MSDKKRGRGRPRLEAGPSEKITFRLRRGTAHDDILAVMDTLPPGARSAWITHALLCYVRGEIRDREREAAAISEDLAEDLFSMWDDDGEEG